ncbi:MAG: transcription factor WhiB [Pseudonocardiales bacterium]|nr:transcription factor WhiB [Pseudonocardiales bacterium]
MILSPALPAAIADNWDWQSTAACRGVDPEAFFLPAKSRGPEKRMHEAAAKTVCARCPIQRRCLEWALSVGETYGVWGGTTPEERDAMGQPRRRTA